MFVFQQTTWSSCSGNWKALRRHPRHRDGLERRRQMSGQDFVKLQRRSRWPIIQKNLIAGSFKAQDRQSKLQG